MNSIELNEMIENHPGMAYYNALRTHATTKSILFDNAAELRLHLLELEDPASQDDYWQDLSRGKLQHAHETLVRQIHNFTASASTLIDHTRIMMRAPEIKRSHRDAYSEQVAHVLQADDESRFVKDLRNYIIHRAIPITEHTLDLLPENQRAKVYLALFEMIEWEKWSVASRRYLDSHTPKLHILTFLDLYMTRLTPSISGMPSSSSFLTTSNYKS